MTRSLTFLWSWTFRKRFAPTRATLSTPLKPYHSLWRAFGPPETNMTWSCVTTALKQAFQRSPTKWSCRLMTVGITSSTSTTTIYFHRQIWTATWLQFNKPGPPSRVSIAHLYGLQEGRRNNNALLGESKSVEKCAEYAVRVGTDETTPAPEHYFQLFGDLAYGNSHHMISLFSGPGERTAEELTWNAEMSAMRIEVEHGFGIVLNQWPFLNDHWKHRVYASPVGRYYRVAVLLTNAMNTLRPNQVSQFFKCTPPSLEEYFHG